MATKNNKQHKNLIVKVISVAEKGQLEMSIDEPSALKLGLPVTSVKFTHKGQRVLCSYAGGLVKMWSTRTGRCVFTLREKRQCLSLATSNDHSQFVVTGSTPQIYLYSNKGNLISTYEPTEAFDKMDGHRSRVFAARFHPSDPNVFISGGWDSTVQFWDTRQRHSFGHLFGPHICGDALDIDPIHNHIITGSWRKANALQIWDYGSARLITNVSVPEEYQSLLYCCEWLGKDDIICGGSNSNVFNLIARSSFGVFGSIRGLTHSVNCCAKLDNQIAVGTGDHLYLLRRVHSRRDKV